jgi:hypothetical protein
MMTTAVTAFKFYEDWYWRSRNIKILSKKSGIVMLVLLREEIYKFLL